MNHLSTQLYKLNFHELILNATNRAYWTKKWTIFSYENNTIEFTLSSIDIINNKLNGKLVATGGTHWTAPTSYITIPLQEEHFLEKALNSELVGKVDNLFMSLGEQDLYKSKDYLILQDLERDFKDKLKGIAEQFLKDNGVYNDIIREAYIEKYIEDNEKDYTSDYIRENRNNTYVAPRITFAYIMGFDDKAKRIAELAEDVDYEGIMEEAEELRQKMEDDDLSEYEENLEGI